MATSYDVADSFLAALGAPRTPAMKRAVAIWLAFESGNKIIGNNPWNLHSGDACPASKGFCPGNGSLPGQIGNRYAGPGDQNVAVFDTLDSGSRASANNLLRLSGAGYGYDRVIAAARQGNPVAFLTALQNSSWSAGHYSHSKLTGAFRTSNSYSNTVTLLGVSGSGGHSPSNPASSDPASGMLGAWGGWVSFPVGHILTPGDVDTIMNVLTAHGFFAGDSLLGGTQTKVRQILTAHVGEAWNKQLQDTLSGEFAGAATTAGVDPITQVATAVGEFGNTVVRVFGFLIAVALIGFGLYIYSKGQPQQETPVAY
jgi:hypothetical protein